MGVNIAGGIVDHDLPAVEIRFPADCQAIFLKNLLLCVSARLIGKSDSNFLVNDPEKLAVLFAKYRRSHLVRCRNGFSAAFAQPASVRHFKMCSHRGVDEIAQAGRILTDLDVELTSMSRRFRVVFNFFQL